MNRKEEYKTFLWILGFFLFAYFMPLTNLVFKEALLSAFELIKWYAQEHVLLCLVPAFFIAGVIAVFVGQEAVIKYFGANVKKWLSYLVASVSGTILAVCSCTILPLFSGIHKLGAGLGPAIAFLYSGPAINILAIILTARNLGFELGIARIVGAVVFSVVIGLTMNFIYRKEEAAKAEAQLTIPEPEKSRSLWQTSFHFFVLVFILVFANWSKPDTSSGLWYHLYDYKWMITAFFGLLFSFSLIYILKLNKWHVLSGMALTTATHFVFPENPLTPFIIAVVALSVMISIKPGEPREWMTETWGFTKQILPLLAAGVLVAGFLLGSQ